MAEQLVARSYIYCRVFERVLQAAPRHDNVNLVAPKPFRAVKYWGMVAQLFYKLRVMEAVGRWQ